MTWINLKGQWSPNESLKHVHDVKEQTAMGAGIANLAHLAPIFFVIDLENARLSCSTRLAEARVPLSNHANRALSRDLAC